MTIPTIFQTCRPRADVLTGSVSEADFAADLAQVIAGRAGEEYGDPTRFFARTWPTRGLRNLLANGVLAHTPWGEIAFALADKAGYERFRNSDEQGIAPGAETLRELFGGRPTLILLDELSVYLRKVQRVDHARDQAIHRSHPRRVLMALRVLLTDGATGSSGAPSALPARVARSS